MQLTPHQTQAMDRLKAFIENKVQHIFILKGYAGTGKTTLVGHLVEYLQEHTDWKPILLATTGRAAKVLQDKTGKKATTIHSCIYSFDKLDGVGDQPWDSENGQLFLDFSLKQPDPDDEGKHCYIVDEASMITHEINTKAHTAKFGTGSLLNDFLSYATGQKVVFVGDPCQLPPIAENLMSSALDLSFLQMNYSQGVEEIELTEIIRQQGTSEILRLAGNFRELARTGQYVKYPQVSFPAGQQAHLLSSEDDLVRDYLKHLRGEKGYEKATMLSYANWQVNKLNSFFRKELFGRPEVQEGELLMVVQNSYKVDLVNGDQVIVRKIGETSQRAGFTFVELVVQSLHDERLHKTLLITDLLYNKDANLSSGDARKLLIDFDQRVRRKGIKRNSDEYRERMQKDPYLNALRAKFGYALTCHKAQGGEWEHVYLNIYKSVYGFSRPQLYRWYYTAITRARDHLHLNDGWWIEGYNDRVMG